MTHGVTRACCGEGVVAENLDNWYVKRTDKAVKLGAGTGRFMVPLYCKAVEGLFLIHILEPVNIYII